MPAPRWLAQFNRHVTNRLTGGLARYLPGFGVVEHVGRKSQRTYRTPVCVFPHSSRYIFALTYGPDTDWIRNVLAKDGCTLETRGRKHTLRGPRIFHDEQRRSVPALVRLILSLGRVNDFLELEEVL